MEYIRSMIHIYTINLKLLVRENQILIYLLEKKNQKILLFMVLYFFIKR